MHAYVLPVAVLLPLACGAPLPGGGSDDGNDTDAQSTGEPDVWDELLEPVPGSRLRPVIRIADDGTRAHVGWHDPLFDTPCEFRHTTSAGLRCVPSTYGDRSWLYADSNCSQPVLQDHAIPEGASVVRARGDGCFDYDYYEVGEPVAEIYYDNNGPCQFFSNDPAHRVVAIPHDQFVAATLTPQEGNGRIVPLLLEADDGARQIFGAWDRVHDEEVRPSLDASDDLRWFGRHQPRVSTLYFADPGCTERVAIAECIPDSDHPTTARETESGYCGAVLGRHALLEEIGQFYALRDDGACESASLPAGYNGRAWRVDAPLLDGDFAQTSTINDGGVRLRHDIYASPEGAAVLASTRFYDLLSSEAQCDWRDPSLYTGEPSTGTLDCVPRGAATLDNRYLDSGCMAQTASRYVPEESCLPETLFAYAGGLIAALAGPVDDQGDYELDDEDDCVAVELEGGSGDGGFGEDEYYLVDDVPTVEAAHASDFIE